MLQVRSPAQERKAFQIKSADNLKNSTVSTVSSVATNRMQVTPAKQVVTLKYGTTEQPFTIRVNPGNIPNSSVVNINQFDSPTKIEDPKAVNLKKIGDLVLQLKKTVNAYRYFEKDEGKCKQNIFHWFHEIESAFVISLNSETNTRELQTSIQELTEIKNKRSLASNTEPRPPIFPLKNNTHLYEREIQSLKIEIETHKRNSFEAIGKINDIYNLLAMLKTKYENQKKEMKALTDAVDAYVEQADKILDKITGKYQKEKNITLIEREVQQVLTKLKFKTFNYQYKA